MMTMLSGYIAVCFSYMYLLVLECTIFFWSYCVKILSFILQVTTKPNFLAYSFQVYLRAITVFICFPRIFVIILPLMVILCT